MPLNTGNITELCVRVCVWYDTADQHDVKPISGVCA